MSLPFNLPYWDWTTAFRPETWPVLILPLSHGLAGWWWAWSWILAVGAYALVLRLLPRRHVVAAGLSLTLLFAPFVQWWYLPITLLSLGWACWASIAALALAQSQPGAARVVRGALLAYTLVALGLTAYVPYVLPCALVLLAVTVGWLFRIDDDVPLRSRLPSIVWTLGSGLAAGAVLALFVLTRYQTIARISSTVYPDTVASCRGAAGWSRSCLARLITPFCRLPRTSAAGP